VLEASPRALGVVADVVKITLGDDPKRADRRQRAALGSVDFVDAFTVTYLPSIAPLRKVEVSREHVSWMVVSVALACTPAAAEAAVPGVAAISSLVRPRIVSVEHGHPNVASGARITTAQPLLP
jgi:hypothetical protein